MSSTTDIDQPEETDETNASPDSEAYGCPYCPETFARELHVRIHVTRSKDSDHLHQNGMMPETAIEQRANGEVIDTISRRPRDIDPSDLTIDDYPDTLPEHHKHILLVAARNPTEDTYAALTDTANQRLTQQGFDTVSYSTVRRTIQSFYRPQKVRAEDDGSDQSDTTQPE
jgi:hypothetical protein